MPNCSKKVLIYNYDYDPIASFKEGMQDCRTLCQSVFNDCDILETNFEQNFDGLTSNNKPLIIIPGGSLMYAANALKNTKISQLIQDNCWDYMGICAGAYLGGSSIDLFQKKYNYDIDNHFLPPKHVLTIEANHPQYQVLNLANINALGPFYPNAYYEKTHAQVLRENCKPYSTLINLANTIRYSLYLDGCGFDILHNRNIQVNATYCDKNSYEFINANQLKENITNLAAIVSKSKTDLTGAVLLSGVHIEATVTNSATLGFFKPTSSSKVPLHVKEYNQLIAEQEDSHQAVIGLIKNLFS